MLSLTATQAAIIAASSKEAKWAFYIYDKNGVGYSYRSGAIGGVAWATGISWASGVRWDDVMNLSSIVLTDFSGIELRRSMAENTIICPSEVTFNISNGNNSLIFSDFSGGIVFIELWVSDGLQDCKIEGWKFRIKTAEPGYQNIRICAEDYLQHYLRGDYPNTRIVQDIFPSGRSYENEGVCIPVPFGTAYVPLRDVFIDGTITYTASTLAAVASASGARCKITDTANGLGSIQQGAMVTVSGFTNPANNGDFIVNYASASEIQFDITSGLVDEGIGDSVTITHGSNYLVLGDTSYTYAITKVRNPSGLGAKSEYSSASYTFTQSTIADAGAVNWRVFQHFTADNNNDGTADGPGYFGIPGGVTYDPSVQFTRSDTASITNPADVIAFVLKDMGIPAAYIDETGTFAAAHAIFDGYTVPLTFNGAFWYKESREKVLAKLLSMCHSMFRVTEKIELHVLSKTSQKTITNAEIMRRQDVGEGTFEYRDILAENYSDSGYVAWQQSGEAQDMFLKLLVPAKGTTRSVVSGDIVECPFVSDSRDVQRIGTLHYQRKFLRDAEVSFTALGTCLALQPDDVVTINHANYGGNYAVLIDSMKINKDLSIDIKCSHYSSALDDWADLTPTTVTIPEDTTPYGWRPTISGPQTNQDIGRASYDLWGKEYLTVSPVANAGKFTDIQKALNAVQQAGGGAIYLLNGEYQMTAPLYIPDVNLEILGQSQGGVVLKNHAGDDLFVMHNLTKTFNFHQFSISSQNVAAFSKMLHIYGDTAADNTANINAQLITMMLADAAVHDGLGDYGIYAKAGIGKLDCFKNMISKGSHGIYAEDYDHADIIKNMLDNQISAGIESTDLDWITVNDNEVRNFWYYGIHVGAGTVIYTDINDNIVTAVSDQLAAKTLFGIYSYASKGSISRNRIKIISGRTGLSPMYGMVLRELNHAQALGNTLDLQIVSTGNVYGIYFKTALDSQIANNTVKLDNTDTTVAHYGISLYTNSLRNVIQGNTVDLVNNDANDRGITLTSGSDNNQGGDNITYNCGVSISDFGAGNTVTAKDV